MLPLLLSLRRPQGFRSCVPGRGTKTQSFFLITNHSITHCAWLQRGTFTCRGLRFALRNVLRQGNLPAFPHISKNEQQCTALLSLSGKADTASLNSICLPIASLNGEQGYSSSHGDGSGSGPLQQSTGSSQDHTAVSWSLPFLLPFMQ